MCGGGTGSFGDRDSAAGGRGGGGIAEGAEGEGGAGERD